MECVLFLTLRRREDFVRLNREGRFCRGSTVTVRALDRSPGVCLATMPGAGVQDALWTGDEAILCLPRVGWTVTRRLGGSVVRHRIRRRMKEALRVSGVGQWLDPAADYVFVAHPALEQAPFDHVKDDLVRVIHGVHRFLRRGPGGERGY